ncbi:hypothetical protein VSR01_18080 [Actinacidiphila sp. DG2A-62]|nr:hypothetical protein [Actinacidiphila sp. DG2A-62]MEC3995340.1 hypothetical protein [Actinacidiphila sp. DG2A-62]
MISDRMAQVLRTLQIGAGSDAIAHVVSAVGAGALGMDGLAVSLVTGDDLTESMWCSDATTRHFEDLQFTLGEGPGPDAARTGAMVWAPDLVRIPFARWPGLTMEAPDVDIRAVFCFPLSIGAISVGVLTAVRHTPGPMTAQQIDDATVLAAALTTRCLDGGPQGTSIPGGSPAPCGTRWSTRQPACSASSSRCPCPKPCCGCAHMLTAAGAPSPMSPRTSWTGASAWTQAATARPRPP